jgi:hypothetical protein
MGSITYDQVRTNFDLRVSSGEFQSVPAQKHDTGRRFTTEEAIRAEHDVLSRMRQGQDASPRMMSREQVLIHADTRPLLNPAQRAAIEQVLQSRDQIQGLQGLAGTGKTTTLESIRHAAEQNGYAVEGFAPTSRAARQLREAGIPADTLQAFLARGGQQQAAGDPSSKHFYMVDESSLASTKQMREFLYRISPQDKVLLVGDTRQHQGVDAGKPFEELQLAGMRTAQLDQIVRQKDPQLLAVVEHFSRNETAAGVALLQQQGRIVEIADPQQRIGAIAKQYTANPDQTMVVSPDNASRLEINQAVRKELQAIGIVEKGSHSFGVLTPRSDLTGTDRTWAASYQPGDVLQYHRGSKELSIERQSYAQVVAANAKENLLTVKKPDGEQLTYKPSRLRGVSAYREIELEFSVGDRLQFTAPNRELAVANRDMGVIERIAPNGEFSVRLLESEKTVAFDPKQMRHFDHGYAMTSYSAQGLTAERVLLNIDSNMHPDLINSRLAYVSVSRAEHDAQVYTNDASRLSEQLSRDVTKTSALQAHAESQILAKESPMSTNQDLPASIYAGNISNEVIQQDIRTIKQGIAEHAPPAEIAHNIVDQHWRAKGESLAAATHVYAADLYQSVAKHPEYSIEQHVASMQPMAADRERWEPLTRAVPIEIADSFQWTARKPSLLRDSVPGARQEAPQSSALRLCRPPLRSALPSTALVHRSVPRWGTPPLALAAPAGVGQGQGVFVSKHSTAIQKRRNNMSSTATNETSNVNSLPTAPKPQTSKEVIAANVKLLIEQLEAGHSEGLTAYLTAMGKFHNYSFGNILEIARQMPSASRVAGMYAWNQLGRRVKKGQKGIRILAPLMGTKRKKDSEAEKDTPNRISPCW